MEAQQVSTENTTTTSSIMENSESTVAKTARLLFNIEKQCPIQYVTVYNDRAEVTRLLQHRFDARGTYDLVLEGFSPFVDETSLHVSGGTGKACTILEVSYQTSYEDLTDQADLTPLDQLKKELEELESEIAIHNQEIQRVNKQHTWLEGRAAKLMNEDGQVQANDLEMMSQFMEFYHRTLLRLDDQRVKEEADMKKLRDREGGVREKLRQHNAGHQLENRKKRREITITVHIGTDNIDVNLNVSYLISHCSWSASYDVRVNSQTTSQQQTQLTYYGSIVNQSQENWSDAQFSLSTATPSSGGSPPKLNTLKINYYQPPYIAPSSRHFDMDVNMVVEQGALLDSVELCSSNAFGKKKLRKVSHFLGRTSLSSKDVSEDNASNTDSTINVLSTTTEASLSSSSFAIPRRCTIESDGKPHKVTIGVLDLTSTFTYTVIPKLSLHAYLKASTVNSSDKQLLAGPASVFMDNNFVTHSSIDNVTVGDTFDLPLGTDASIKVEYKPVKMTSDTQGLISKTRVEVIRRETLLSNTKSAEVTVHVYEQIPLSSDEKIKVKVTTPDLKIKNPVAHTTMKMNDDNVLEWTCVVQPKHQCRLPLEFILEWPKDRLIEYNE